ncbi:glycosyltransferase [Acidothermaceae bacterium B102]|nr:glycosyltransferase [Acidothermaceae bacterium B102]
MKVLHVSQPVTEGVANWVVDLVADQRGRGYETVVACPGSSPLSERVRALGSEQRDWAASRQPGPSVLDEVRRLRRIVADVRPDLVHLHSSKAGLAGRLAMRGSRPTVFQPHGWSFQATTGVLRQATVRWESFGSRWADRILCVSEGEAEEAAGIGIRRDRLAVVSNGVDLSSWPAADAAARTEARERLGLDPSAPLAVNVGRLSRQKGQDLLLAAWPSVRSAVPGARLYLIGDGPDRPALEAAVAGTSDVVLYGASTEVPLWLAATDVVVMASRWEGMSLSVLEAAAVGRPLVVTDVAGMRDVVGAGAEAAGQVVPLDPAETFAARFGAAIAARLGDPQQRDREAGFARTRVEERFSITRAFDATVALYDACIAHHH